MKRTISLLLAAAFCLSLTACGVGGDSPSAQPSQEAKTPEELAEAYAQAIEAARDDELNEYYPVMTNASQADPTEQELLFTLLGLAPEDMSAYAMAVSLRNVNAYAVVAVMPAPDREEDVKTALEGYIDSQKQAFERYLEDQYQIAADAKLNTLADGTVLLVMCEGQDEIFHQIETNLAG